MLLKIIYLSYYILTQDLAHFISKKLNDITFEATNIKEYTYIIALLF